MSHKAAVGLNQVRGSISSGAEPGEGRLKVGRGLSTRLLSLNSS